MQHIDSDFFNDENEIDLFQPTESHLERHLTFTHLSSNGTNNSFLIDLENQNDDATNDQDSFFIDSASRTFTELINVPLPHTQAFSPSANIPFSNSTSINTSTLPSVHLSSVPSPIDSSGPRILTPETVAKAIYNQLLNDKLSPILPSSKPTSSRIRKERKFGEVVTSDSFLQEIKQKTQKKLMKPRVNKSNVTKAKATSIKQKKKK